MGKIAEWQIRENLLSWTVQPWNKLCHKAKGFLSCVSPTKVASECLCPQRIPVCRKVDLKCPFQLWESRTLYRAGSRKMQKSAWVGGTSYVPCNRSAFTCSGSVKQNGNLQRRLKHCFPWVLASLPCLSLASTLLDSIFLNYFHRNKYTTYTLDDQEIWQPEKNYMSQEDNCTFFFLITAFLNLHPSPGFPSTVLRHHSALIVGFLYPLQPLGGSLSWSW